ncbi:glycine betaine ABC transporter substrate-binding protein [Shouchella shacheensis]|uniref:glycine betaine ABC transporter substrate-binding protein n=1 Tax=Shouchella shacheensis TaxID=1649580 RepID=UPI0007403097|nr:glycine betaine ABC transporter substrate-binding protein [Shouchella shacheensis]
MKWKHVGMTASLTLAVTLAACGDDNGDTGENGDTGNGGDDNGSSASAEDLEVITGIDAGAGVVEAAEDAVEEYNLAIDVQTSSGAVMTQQLGDAIENEEPIVVTGWTPHWKFTTYDLKYLEDPEGVFGGEESIHTMTRLGLEEDMPEAHQVLDNFFWHEDDMGEIMVEIAEGEEEEVAAQNWVDANEDTVAEWTDGVDEVDGESIELVYVQWDSEVASTNVVAIVLESIGYDVTMTSVENGPMWEALSSGEADASTAAWLPLTHGSFYEDHQDDVVDLGENLEGSVAIGLVVPEYMDIDSIEELPTN